MKFKKEINLMNKEFNGFDEMVEALEENEDMVECKECFDLVPKVDCERAEVGYICPTCRGLRTAPAQARFVDPYDSYTQDFPEVTDYDPDSVVEYEKEPGLGDALSDLIRDEYEAIDGYEVADETIQHADIDEEDKDEILDTLDHIKEEEEEHIDELKELCPECDPVAEPETEPVAEPEVEPEKLEEAAEEVDDEEAAEEAEVEEIPEEESPEEEAEDSEENENEEVSDLDSAYEAALEIANESGVGQVFGYARKETEEFVAIEPFEVDDPEAVEDDLMAVYDDVAYAYVAYPERSLEESLFESVQLNEAPLGFLGIGNPAKLFDSFFSKTSNHGGYQIKALNSGDGNKEETVDIPGIGDISKRVFNDYTSATKAAKQASKLAQYSHLRFTVLPKNFADLNSTSATIKSTLEKLSKIGLTAFRKGNVVPVVQSQVDVAVKALKKAAKSDKKLARLFLDGADPEADNTDSEDAGSNNETENNSTTDTTGSEDTGSDTTSSDGEEVTGDNAEDAAAVETEETSEEEPKEETAAEEAAPAPAVKPETFKLLDKIFVKGYAISINGEAPKNFKAGTSSAAVYEAVKKQSGKTTEEGKPVYLCANVITEADLSAAQNAKELMRLLNTLIGKTYQKPIAKFKSSAILLAAFKDGEAIDLKKTKNLLALIESQRESFEEYFNEESLFDETEPEAESETGSSETDATSAESPKAPEGGETGSKLKAGAKNVVTAFRDALGSLDNKIGRNQANARIIAAMEAAGLKKPTTGEVKKFRKALLGESLDMEEDINTDAHETADALQNTAKTIGRMSSAAKAAVGTIKNTIQEEYHRYANPAELKAMEDIEELAANAVTKVYDDIATWGYEATEIATQSWLCQEDETCLQYMLEFKDLDPDEIDDLASQLEMQLENEISVYKPVPEIRGISVSVALPDYDLADADDEAEGITKASFLFYVDFARNLY
jgi:hypothetical protein